MFLKAFFVFSLKCLILAAIENGQMSKENIKPTPNGQEQEQVISLNGMYQDYFLDYASYVILERAVPGIGDGLKPVQRRIFHAMKEMDDGRYNKVANVIGQTMQYHPHGDAAIGDAMVNLGQKELMIDTQGNWGDPRTGDRAAASRYIEARLTKFALEVAFNPQTTEWQISYDGRKKEPINLPMKFPLVLAQGAEGIAVGLSTKILPHNFIELIKASIKILEDKKVKIYPDFLTGGFVDVTDYRGGKRGGKIKVRARIEAVDKKILVIKDLPYGETTSSLIDDIIKANDKGKIKIKKVIDNTAKDVEIQVELASGISPEVTIDALYAFTKCEKSISPNACIIIDNKPHFVTVEEILRFNTLKTKDLLRQELEIEKASLEEKLHFASLEKIFIENRIYREIEECETWEAVIETIDRELKKYVAGPSDKPKANDKRLRLLRDVSEDDIVRLTEIKIKRISKFNSFKADELIAKLEEALKEVKHNLAHLTEYTISYYTRLLEKYGKGRERKTEITTFDTIKASMVVANNAKLYVNKADGFIGTALKKDEFVCDCSDIDDIIVFKKDASFQVVKIDSKVFVGKGIIHVAVWKKGDERTTYNMIYLNSKNGRTMAKRFNVKSITRTTTYPPAKGLEKSKLLYFSANLNGEAEIVHVQLTQGSKARKKMFDFDFSTIDIKGRGAAGNILTRYPVRKITLKEAGKSTLGAIKVWMDEVSGRLNTSDRGVYLGAFDTGDNLLVIFKSGEYQILELDIQKKFDANDVVHIGKLAPETVISAVYFEGGKQWTMVKRFHIESNKLGQMYNFLSEHTNTKLYFASVAETPKLQYAYRVKGGKEEGTVNIAEFIDVKGWKALGNKLIDKKLSSFKDLTDEGKEAPKPSEKDEKKLSAGDTIDFDVEGNGQTKMF